MADLAEEDVRTKLKTGVLSQFDMPSDWTSAPVDHFEFQLHSNLETAAPPEEVAFAVLRQVYLEFGLDPSGIPYSHDGKVDAGMFPRS
jgi:hypothetical protein